MNWKGFDRKQSHSNQGTIPAFAWRMGENHVKPVRRTSVLPAIETDTAWMQGNKCYHYTNLVNKCICVGLQWDNTFSTFYLLQTEREAGCWDNHIYSIKNDSCYKYFKQHYLHSIFCPQVSYFLNSFEKVTLIKNQLNFKYRMNPYHHQHI
jgi:hypothetical protein